MSAKFLRMLLLPVMLTTPNHGYAHDDASKQKKETIFATFEKYKNVSNSTPGFQNFIKSHKDVINTERNDQGQTLLHAAIQYDNPILVECLLQHGADPFIPDDNQKTALGLAYHTYYSPWGYLWPFGYEHTRKIWNLLTQQDTATGRTLLHRAVSSSDFARLSKENPVAWLKETYPPLDVNSVDKEGKTAFWYAVEKGNQILVHQLLAAGAHPDTSEQSEPIPLQVAIKQGNQDLIQFISDGYRTWLEVAYELGEATGELGFENVFPNSFEIISKNDDLVLARFSATWMDAAASPMLQAVLRKEEVESVQNWRNKYSTQAWKKELLEHALTEDSLQVAQWLLKAPQKSHNKLYNPEVISKKVAEKGATKIGKWLIETYKDNFLASLLTESVQQKKLDLFKALTQDLENLAQIINQHNLLDLAVQNSDIPMAKHLIDKGAKVNQARKQDGRTPVFAVVTPTNDELKLLMKIKEQAPKQNPEIKKRPEPAKTLRIQMLELLKEKGAQLDISNSKGCRPQDLAKLYGLDEVVAYFKKETATPADSKRCPVEDCRRVFLLAVLLGDIPRIQALLDYKQIDAVFQTNWLLLYLSPDNKDSYDPKVLEAWLKEGEFVPSVMCRFLLGVAKSGDQALFKQLLKGYPINAQHDEQNNTTLLHMLATLPLDIAFVKLCTEQGADIHLQDRYNHTPLDFAKHRKNSEVAAHLQDLWDKAHPIACLLWKLFYGALVLGFLAALAYLAWRYHHRKV